MLLLACNVLCVVCLLLEVWKKLFAGCCLLFGVCGMVFNCGVLFVVRR